jgi:DNA-binding protein HU-beta
MNKAELVTSVASKSKLTKKDSEAGIRAFIDSVEETLAKGQKVQLMGFGNFKTVERAARAGRNPRTKEEIKIPASKQPKFTAGSEFKKTVSK